VQQQQPATILADRLVQLFTRDDSRRQCIAYSMTGGHTGAFVIHYRSTSPFRHPISSQATAMHSAHALCSCSDRDWLITTQSNHPPQLTTFLRHRVGLSTDLTCTLSSQKKTTRIHQLKWGHLTEVFKDNRCVLSSVLAK